MEIQDQAHVSIEFTLTLDSGEVVDRSEPGEPLEFIFGKCQVWPALEKRLDGLSEGEHVEFTVEPAQGFGLPNPSLVRGIPRDQFPEGLDIQPGMVFRADTGGSPIVFNVKSVTDDEVMADFNHPLAGERLNFDVTVKGVRQATDEELQAAEHACGPGGCSGCGHDHGETN